MEVAGFCLFVCLFFLLVGWLEIPGTPHKTTKKVVPSARYTWFSAIESCYASLTIRVYIGLSVHYKLPHAYSTNLLTVA